MNTARRRLLNTRSARTRIPPAWTGWSFRNLNPARWTKERILTSGRVLALGFAFMTAVAAAEVGCG